MESYADDLFEAVGSVSSSGIITTVFDLVGKGFYWLIDVIRGAENGVIFL